VRSMYAIIKDQDPLTLSPGTTVKHACRSMRDRRVGAVLVTDTDGRLLGIFTGRDAVCRVLAEAKDPGKTRLSEVMTRDPDTIAPGSRAIDALRKMQDGGYRHVPIVEDDKVMGVASRGDFKGMELERLEEETGLWERI
jgi:CBS domain-containing protein